MKLAGANIVVTGASSGIGEAAAKALAARGAHVALLARTYEALERIAREIGAAGGSAFVYPVDLGDADATARVAEAIVREHGCPDVLINNAGAGRWLYADETRPSDAVAMMALPYFAAFNLTAALLPCMLARRSGTVVNVTSPASFSAWPGATGYTAARWAIRGFTQALRADLHGSGVRAMLAVLGETASAYWQNNPGAAERLPRLRAFFPPLRPQDAASALVRGLERDSSTVIAPFQLRFALTLHSIWQWPMDRLLIATGHRRGKDLSAVQPPKPAPGGPPLQT
ncbi:MAG: SDR family NAD(P)-dependent oxidoreductase [Candidatus Eremiobacteraeota bacterium]|nr:SDR family NAD(P)-dependent oxidoreductase [Candidatus Eremiobacteraeota bacterium]